MSFCFVYHKAGKEGVQASTDRHLSYPKQPALLRCTELIKLFIGNNDGWDFREAISLKISSQNILLVWVGVLKTCTK